MSRELHVVPASSLITLSLGPYPKLQKKAKLTFQLLMWFIFLLSMLVMPLLHMQTRHFEQGLFLQGRYQEGSRVSFLKKSEWDPFRSTVKPHPKGGVSHCNKVDRRFSFCWKAILLLPSTYQHSSPASILQIPVPAWFKELSEQKASTEKIWVFFCFNSLY